jgi:Spy/CpxP family protein refolding chaperone
MLRPRFLWNLASRLVVGGVAIALMGAVPAAAQGTDPTSAPENAALQQVPDESVADAQDQQRPPRPEGARRQGGPIMEHWHRGMHGRRGMWRAPLTMMMRHRDELGLSPAQVQNLEKLRGDYMREAIRHQADRKIARLDLMTLLRPDPADPGKPVDMAKVETKIREIEKMRADARVARVRTIEAGKAQLTPEQRTKLAGLMGQLRSRWQRGGPPPRPMAPGPPRG